VDYLKVYLEAGKLGNERLSDGYIESMSTETIEDMSPLIRDKKSQTMKTS